MCDVKWVTGNWQDMRKIFTALLAFIMAGVASASEFENPKREFRGAWLHVIGQTQWQNKNT